MRTFIAIDLSLEIKDKLVTLVNHLKPLGKNIKWVARENYHLTLKFLGEISESEMEDIKKTLDEVAGRHNSFNLKLKGTGSFPPGSNRIRIVWVGITNGERLLSLQKEIEIELEKRGFPKENRPFSPHLTIGRVKRPEKQDKLASELEKNNQQELGSMMVREITFFQSILRPQGPEYHILSRHLLS
ncbi:MAG TPA: RNA 2',3'-cyclic phosphodiesterase [Candidatus Saccharicenans sp.]|nr:RNA 2',3'-cyclic phosphodiesterase [Candidatus Saccharicenans sp.]HRD01144.1 RNA 2',3'-cyclic phosphodiesterase [Candidatus Saccharicenans sp.]